MLYLKLSTNQNYTAYQALNLNDEDIVPLRLPGFSAEEIEAFSAESFSCVTTRVLSLFFGKIINKELIDNYLEIHPLSLDGLDRKTLLIKLRSERDQNIIDDLFQNITSISGKAGSWATIAIRISLLFGIYADLKRCGISQFDIAVYSNELRDLLPVYYARKMGLPINKIICGCIHEDGLWGLLREGKVMPKLNGRLASLLYFFNSKECVRYLESCQSNSTYNLTPEQFTELNDQIFTAVVSVERSKELFGNAAKTFGKNISPIAAVSYGALQDYRSVTGENDITLILID